MALEEFTYGREDFTKMLEYLYKNIEEGNSIDLWSLVERLYDEKEKLGFRRYFQRTYPIYDFSQKKDYPYDPYLIWDLIFLEKLSILRRNKEGYEINKDTLSKFLRYI